MEKKERKLPPYVKDRYTVLRDSLIRAGLSNDKITNLLEESEKHYQSNRGRHLRSIPPLVCRFAGSKFVTPERDSSIKISWTTRKTAILVEVFGANGKKEKEVFDKQNWWLTLEDFNEKKTK